THLRRLRRHGAAADAVDRVGDDPEGRAGYSGVGDPRELARIHIVPGNPFLYIPNSSHAAPWVAGTSPAMTDWRMKGYPCMPQLSNMAHRDIETVIHPYTNLSRHRETGPLILNEGRGIYVYDDKG